MYKLCIIMYKEYTDKEHIDVVHSFIGLLSHDVLLSTCQAYYLIHIIQGGKCS